jgi:uncharacterized protein
VPLSPTSEPTRRLTHLLYLHGFRSSPQSTKARKLCDWLRRHRPDVVLECPQLPPSPRQALELARGLVRTWPTNTMAIVGSSLGGFYAAALTGELGCRALMLNPAIDPARDLEAHIGVQASFHDPASSFDFTPLHVRELRAVTPTPATQPFQRPDRVAAIIAKGDEVLDWREMRARYAGTTALLLDGSDHALSDFDDHLDFVLRFIGAREPATPRPSRTMRS